MQPDGHGISANDTNEADHVDPYLVSLVTRDKSDARQKVETIRAVMDELSGTSTRRRAQLLNSSRR